MFSIYQCAEEVSRFKEGDRTVRQDGCQFFPHDLVRLPQRSLHGNASGHGVSLEGQVVLFGFEQGLCMKFRCGAGWCDMTRQTHVSFLLGSVDHLRQFLGDDIWRWRAPEVWICRQQLRKSVQAGKVQAILLINLLRVCSRKDGDAVWTAELEIHRLEVGVNDCLEDGVWGRLHDLRLSHIADVQWGGKRGTPYVLTISLSGRRGPRELLS